MKDLTPVSLPVAFSIQCILAAVTMMWVILPLVQFSKALSPDDIQTEWIFDLTEDERGGEKETEKDQSDDEEKTHNPSQLESERDARAALTCVVRLTVALEERPTIEDLEQPPRA